MTSILILRGGAVGDFILTLPVFDALRRHWPQARIDLANYPRMKRLALETGLADAFYSLDSPVGARLFASGEAREPGPLGWRLRDSDLVLSYLHDPDGLVGENLARAGAKRVVCASPIVASGHAVDHLLRPLADLGVPVKGGDIPRLCLPRPKEGPNPGWQASGAESLSVGSALPLFGLHPGSGSARKNWPTVKFAELAQRIREEKLGVPFFSFGEADAAAAQELARRAPDVPVLRGLDLLDLAGVLSTCAGYVGNDSGITHLAAAVGIPTVAIFGPTDPAVWGPRGPNVRLLRAPEPTPESLARIGVEEVLARLLLPRV